MRAGVVVRVAQLAFAAGGAVSGGRTSGDRIEVRQGRRGRVLRINGTYASWYRPGTPRTGSVWDALAAPLLLLPPARRRRVLILGLGGGSAARLVHALAPRVRIVGVEVSARVVRAARRHFDLDELGVEIVQDDARHYLDTTRRQFDVVIEDVFVGRGRNVHKPDWLPRPGLRRAARHLVRGGLLISNSIDETPAVARSMRALFPSVLAIGVEGYDNRVVVGGPAPLDARTLRSAVAANRVLAQTVSRLSFRKLTA
jgi:spermidine synthase